MSYKDEASVVNLLSGCPKLQNLVVTRNHPDVDIFTIAVPSLQRLTIFDDCNWDDIPKDRIGGYVINAPSLKYLKIEGFTALNFRLIEISSELVEVNIIHVDIKIDEKLLGSLTSVKRLSLTSSPLEITFPTGTIFYRLEYLELSTHLAEWWNLLLLMLYSSPKLQVLKLIGDWYREKEDVACEKWNQHENVSECLKSLTTLHLNKMNYKDEASVLNLLSGCPNLENLVVKRRRHDVDVFTIAVPSLQRLTVDDDYDGDNEEIGAYVMNAPSLKYLKIEGYKGLSCRVNENARELVEANIIDVSITIDEKHFGSLTSVKRLSVVVTFKFSTKIASCIYRLHFRPVVSSISWYIWSFLQIEPSGGSYFCSCSIVPLNCKSSSSPVVGMVKKMWLVRNGINLRMYLNV